MYKVLPIFVSGVCGLTFTLIVAALPSIAFGRGGVLMAHQHQMTPSGTVGATIHVDPDDSPYAGRPSETWFMLTAPDGDPILLADCNCQVMVHNAQDEAIAHDLPLSAISVDDQEAISTLITFPTPGTYTVILSGESKDGSFEPFELTFPITAVSP